MIFDQALRILLIEALHHTMAEAIMTIAKLLVAYRFDINVEELPEATYQRHVDKLTALAVTTKKAGGGMDVLRKDAISMFKYAIEVLEGGKDGGVIRGDSKVVDADAPGT